MKKRSFALILAFAMLFALSACSVSGSSSTTTTVSTSVTDADGNTTTNTVTNEMGVSAGPDGIKTTNETTTEKTTSVEGSMAEFFPPKEEWYDVYAEGGEGENEDGDRFYFAYNDPEDVTYAMILIAFANGDIMVRNGEVQLNEEEECLELHDEEMETVIPFIFLETDEENCFAIRFTENDAEVLFEMVDQDAIISDIYDILLNAVSNSQIEDDEAA